jgi:hypothetical protein
MVLKIKEKYLEYSIGGGKVKLIKFKNLPENEYQKYFNSGFKDFFEVVIEEEDMITDEIDEDIFLEEIKIEDLEDDIN